MITIKARHADSFHICEIYNYPQVSGSSIMAAVIRCSTMNAVSPDMRAWIEVNGQELDAERYQGLVDAIERNAGPRTVGDRLARLIENL